MSANSTSIAMEAPVEMQIQEIAFDGQETYAPSLSMSENLTKLAQKIDFAKCGPEEVNKEITEINRNEDEAEQSTAPPIWPWDSVRNKLRNALTEVSVLADLLTIAKGKKYVVLDPVPHDPPELKPMVMVYARKKSFAGAASVLLSGAERLKNSLAEAQKNRTTTADFHIELLRLRQNFRLKKVNNTIIGDLSYFRSSGSKHIHSGTFEVTKSEEEPDKLLSPPCSPNPNSANKLTSALRVTVPGELQGIASIKVYFQKDQDSLYSSNLNTPDTAFSIPEIDWQRKLEVAQNVLFCKEMFNQLAKEAVQLQSPIPHVVVGNQIIASIFPGVQLVICLSHMEMSTDGKASLPPPIPRHDQVLEHTLHQLLRELHEKKNYPLPHPASAPLGPSRKRSCAGPYAMDREEFVEMTESQTMLEQVIQQAQHTQLRDRTLCILDKLATQYKDPLISVHWLWLNSPTYACIKVTIFAQGYDEIYRNLVIIHVYDTYLKCISRDGKVVHLSYESMELKNYILCQICRHQIMAVQYLAKSMGWQCVANSFNLGSGTLIETFGNASSCILVSPVGDRLISIHCDQNSRVQVSVAQTPRKDFFPGQLVKERKWENLGNSFKEVQWEKMIGKNFLSKMELLMTSLTSSWMQ
ncbi:Hypothetical predicted protein [Cloeon dipterum]|uniref:Mediator of RNA polymerase II transcription subunit 17 n=1 Tax=Cloeon dipterum TaxID=197152 RepID=A0A8S1BRS2_9INSE|nr:Hypothetical predicted protein [Cloeon dipterum]